MKNKFTPVDKKVYEDRKLFEETVRIDSTNKAGQCPIYDKDNGTFPLWMDILGWYHLHGLQAGGYRKHVKKLIELIGFKNVAIGTSWYQYSIWCFTWESHYILLFESKRGMTIQVEDFFPSDKVKPFLKDLAEQLKVKEGWRKEKFSKESL